MKTLILFTCFSLGLLTSCVSCDKETPVAGADSRDNIPVSTPSNSVGSKMKITIGTQTFTATLYDNVSANAFKALLPLRTTMTELNGNEKYADLGKSLPTSSSNPGTIQNGDLMLYGSSTLVLFYKTFPTTYSYTRIGRIDNVDGLAEAVGSGNVSVKYMID